MQEQLYRLLKKRTANVEEISPDVLAYEEANKDYSKEIAPLVSKSILVGIEVEVEKVGAGGSVSKYPVWQVKADNSLREGVEYVSIPIRGNRIQYAINQLFDNMPKTAIFSPRTSIHVHMNVLPMTPAQVGNMCLIYGIVERLLYKFVGGERDKSNFCVPFYSSYSGPPIVTAMWTSPWQGVYISENTRYLGLNLDAIRKFGTVEFRHLGGTKNKDKIIHWINLIFRMQQFAIGTDPVALKLKIAKLNTDSNYAAFLEEVFGEHALLLDQGSLQKDMEPAVSDFKRAIYPCKFVNDLKNTFNFKDAYWYKQLQGIKKIKTDGMIVDIGAPIPRAAPPVERNARRAPRGLERALDRGARAGIAIRPAQQPALALPPDPFAQGVAEEAALPPMFYDEPNPIDRWR